MSEEKDRYGDKLREVERAREDKYFADRDRELVDKLHQQIDSTADPSTGPDARGHCPKCGQGLEQVKHLGVLVDECPACHGMWLDKVELEQIAQREANGWLARYLGRPR
jgi:uncharacterized protein